MKYDLNRLVASEKKFENFNGRQNLSDLERKLKNDLGLS